MNIQTAVKLLFVGVFLVVASTAQATVIRYTLDNVTFDDGGTATGFFDWDTSLANVVPEYEGSSVNFQINVSGGDEVTFPPFAYTDEVAGEISSGGTISSVRILRFGDAGDPPNRLVTLIPDDTVGILGEDLNIPLIISPGNSIEIVNIGAFEVREFSSGSLQGEVISGPAVSVPANSWWALVLLIGLLGFAGIRIGRS